MPRRSSLTASDGPAAGPAPGAAARPALRHVDPGPARGRRRGRPRRRGRRGGTTMPPGSGTAASSSSISIPMTAQPGLLGRGHEPDGAVQALVVGDREPGQARARRPDRPARPAATRHRGTRSGCGSGARRTGGWPRDLRSWGTGLPAPASIEKRLVRKSRNTIERSGVSQACTHPSSSSPAPNGRHDRVPERLHGGVRDAPDPRSPPRGHRGPGGVDLAPQDVSAPGARDNWRHDRDGRSRPAGALVSATLASRTPLLGATGSCHVSALAIAFRRASA